MKGFNGTSTKTRIETRLLLPSQRGSPEVLMEHPPKQGLKPEPNNNNLRTAYAVLMEHPPKQGLKPRNQQPKDERIYKVLMEHPPKQGLKQSKVQTTQRIVLEVLMEHPPKQGLKYNTFSFVEKNIQCFNGTSTKTRIETNTSNSTALQ